MVQDYLNINRPGVADGVGYPPRKIFPVFCGQTFEAGLNIKCLCGYFVSQSDAVACSGTGEVTCSL